MSFLVAISVAFATLLPLLLHWRDRRFSTRAVRVLGAQARQIATTSIDALPEGALARAVGTVRPSGPWLVAPFSKTPCAYWRFTVSVLEYSATQRRSHWQHVYDDSQSRRFVLKDGSGTCVVDPELATVDVAVGHRFFYRRGHVPAAVTDVFDRYGMELPHASILIEETSLAVDVSVGVAGIVRRVERPEIVEADYRSGRPMIASFDATLGELLISTERRLRHAGATGKPAGDGERAWGLPAIDEHDRPMASLDDFEADLRRRGKRRVAVGGLVLAVAASFSGMLVYAGLRQPPAPMLTEEHVHQIADAIAQSRMSLASPQLDLDWQAAMSGRDAVDPGDEPCAYERWLADRADADTRRWPLHGPARMRAPVAFTTLVGGGPIPMRSPHSEDAFATLDRVSRELELGALDARAGDLLDDARLVTVDKIDLVVELDRAHHRVRSWLYDHGLERIACVGTSDLGGGRDAMLRAALASLRAPAETAAIVDHFELPPD